MMNHSEIEPYSINSINDERRKLLADVTSDSEVVRSYTEIGEPITVVRHKSQGTSWYAAVFLVVNAALGAGLLNFPEAYHKSGGIVVAVVVQAVLMVFIVGALIILAYCSDIDQACTYQETVHSMCGPIAKHASSLAVALYCFGTCITFLIIIADQWDSFLTYMDGPTFCYKWYFNRKFTLSTTAVIFILPLCFPRRIDFLKYASVLGVIGVVYCVFLVSYKYFQGDGETPGPIRTSPESWVDVFIVVPVICFGYQCHVSVIPIYSCLAKRTVPEFTKTIMVAILICVLTYTFTAIFGYLTFGSKINSDILLGYKHKDGLLLTAVVLIGIKMYTTYPILLFCGRAAFDSVWVEVRQLSATAIADGEAARRIVTVVFWFFLSLILAVFVPNISMVISVLGSLAALFIFTFPGMCLLKMLLEGYVDPTETKVRYWLLSAMAVVYLILGAFIFGVVITQSIWNDFFKARVPSQSLMPCAA